MFPNRSEISMYFICKLPSHEPNFHTIPYISSSTVYTRNFKPGSGGRVSLEVMVIRFARQGDPRGVGLGLEGSQLLM